MPGLTEEDAELNRLRRKYLGQWSVVVCDGEWEALPLGNLREDYAVRAASGPELDEKIAAAMMTGRQM